MEWFYAEGGNRLGPAAPVAFEDLIKNGIIKPQTLVWSSGMNDWQPWGQIVADTATCAASGGRYWQRGMVPYEGRFISADHKEEFFQRLREGVQQPGVMVYGGFWMRFLAKLIDFVIGWVVGMIINVGLAMVYFSSFIFRPHSTDHGAVGKLLAYQGTSFLAQRVFTLLYDWFFLSRFAATPGKMAVGLKVVRSDGSRVSGGRIIGRCFSEWLNVMTLMVGYIVAGFDDERRALHDRICDTRVIKAR